LKEKEGNVICIGTVKCIFQQRSATVGCSIKTYIPGLNISL